MTTPTGALAPDDARAKMAAAVEFAIADAIAQTARAAQIRDRQAEYDARMQSILEGTNNVFPHR